MAKEAEASARKRKASDDVGPEGEEPAMPEPSLLEVETKSGEEASNSNPNPRDNFLFEDDYGCASLCDDNVDIMQHYSDICAVDAVKIPYVGDKVSRIPRPLDLSFVYTHLQISRWSLYSFGCFLYSIIIRSCSFADVLDETFSNFRIDENGFALDLEYEVAYLCHEIDSQKIQNPQTLLDLGFVHTHLQISRRSLYSLGRFLSSLLAGRVRFRMFWMKDIPILGLTKKAFVLDLE